ncbi:MAG: hypothetical protein A2912_05845 [Candidatus Buchananbacteria bacterium RIFCSPLOWO2_01_FULL_40_23b]|uniref:Uncharacterized protein n=1 Tax=Candidatus Buchananbacteria bacterium RIFCSPLOWO2_01_FULL_40_23b TaxID=1797544 RepID=A0A1G1YT29_9BACT|nr:MAG: hypothetical protein A2912_05845 [Candidatus Buchananbacteria bacterium RIFCSPLOWO2_01_FULL_40_23b]
MDDSRLFRAYYNASLQHKLPAANSASPIVLNNTFADWADHISYYVKNRHLDVDERYQEGKDKELFELAQTHARVYEREIESSMVIMLTHPLYLSLSHMNYIDSDEGRRDVEKYEDDLLHLLSMNKSSQSRVGVVLLETLHHYAAASSLLVEAGLVDRVVFTEYDSGIPLNLRELKDFSGKRIYFGGGYNGRCLKNSMDCMAARTSSKLIFGISDLVLNSPQYYGGRVRVSRIDDFVAKRTVTLEEAMRRFNLV